MIFLRGKVPTDRDPSQIMFNNIDECDDVWTQLCRSMIKIIGSRGELWYWGGKRKVQYEDNFIERWIPSFSEKRYDFGAKILFARGGFKEYDQVIQRHKRSFTIYYGAGWRYFPKYDFKDFKLILVDTLKQKEEVAHNFPKSRVELWKKPAADNIFYPIKNEEKKYDIIFVGNYNRGVDKGHDLAFRSIPKDLKVISVGIVPEEIRKKYRHINYVGWVPRKEIPKYYAQSKISLICCGTEDSCPRVIPESLACNCPILVLDRVNFWAEQYVNETTGILSSKDNFVNNIKTMVQRYSKFDPYSYYKSNLSLDFVSKKICSWIG